MNNTTNKRNQHGAVPMRRYAVHLDEATAEYYKAQGGGNRSEGMRQVARDATAAVQQRAGDVDQSSREP